MKRARRAVAAVFGDIGVSARQRLSAAGANPAGALAVAGAYGAAGNQTSQCAPPAAFCAFDQQSVRKPAGIRKSGDPRPDVGMADETVKLHGYSFSYRSTSMTNTVAPPTVTSIGKEE